MHASIDIGTNTVLLLVADVQNGRLIQRSEEQRTPRLGKGVDSSGNLHPDSINRVLESLREYHELLESSFPRVSDVAVTATSAVRDAGNRSEFMQKVREETGFDITLLSGLEEAQYTFSGALSVLPDLTEAIVIDIGGGSTEIAIGKPGTLLDSHSFDMGSVRFTERYLKHDPPGEDEMKQCRDAVKEMIRNREFELNSGPKNPALVGVAGTVTSLAYMDLQLDAYHPEKLNGYILSIDKIKNWINRLSSIDVQEIETRYPKVMKGRADVITGGLLILEGFMEYYSLSELTVSTGGIRHGAILKQVDQC